MRDDLTGDESFTAGDFKLMQIAVENYKRGEMQPVPHILIAMAFEWVLNNHPKRAS